VRIHSCKTPPYPSDFLRNGVQKCLGLGLQSKVTSINIKSWAIKAHTDSSVPRQTILSFLSSVSRYSADLILIRYLNEAVNRKRW